MQFGIGLNTRLENEQPNNIIKTLANLNVTSDIQNDSNLQIIQKISQNIFQKLENNGENFDLANFKKNYKKFWSHTDQIVDIEGGSYKIIDIDDYGYLAVESLEDGSIRVVDPAENRFDMMNGMILQK